MYISYVIRIHTGETTFVAPKEQPPRKLSGKWTVHINSGKRIILAEGANLSGKKTEGV